MPSPRARRRVIRSSAMPSAMLNQPSARATERAAGRRVCLGIRMASSVRFEHHLHATVLLVAERPVHLRAVLERRRMRDDERWVDLLLLDAAQEVVGPAIDVRLAGADGEALVH